MSTWASFRRAYWFSAKLIAILGVSGALIAWLRGESPWISLWLALLALLAVAPFGAIAFIALAPLRARGTLGHYGAWMLTLLVATLPTFAISAWLQTHPAAETWDINRPKEPLLLYYSLGILGGGILWGSFAASIGRARDKAARAIAGASEPQQNDQTL